MTIYNEDLQKDRTVMASDQVIDAMNDLDRPAAAYLRWPWPELDEITGPIGAPGVVWFVCAFSGSGKTTFVTSLIELWRAIDKRIYVMPLEAQPKDFRKHLACVQCGFYPGDVLSGHAASLPNWKDMRARLNETLALQYKAPFVDRVMVSEQRAINVEGLRHGLEEAKEFRADVVIVDHIDHIGDTGTNSNLYAESRAVNHAALRMAQDYDLRLLFTSQLNQEIAKSPDHLAKYQPPRDQHVLMGGVKRQVATGMIGLFRKARDRRPSETDDEYVQAIKDAKAGKIGADKVLDTSAMGVNAMKLRHYGAREGSRVFLGFENGRVLSVAEKDRWVTASGFPRPQL